MGADLPSDLFEGEVRVDKAGYYTDLIAEHGQALLRRQSAAQPFLLSLHFTAPHWPWEGPGDEAVSRDLKTLNHVDGGGLKKYGEIVAALDAAVGRVLATLEERGLAQNNLIVFTSDNGGERFSNTWPLSGQKSELLEGGIRVPTLLRWPARVKPGQVSEQVLISMDWLPVGPHRRRSGEHRADLGRPGAPTLRGRRRGGRPGRRGGGAGGEHDGGHPGQLAQDARSRR